MDMSDEWLRGLRAWATANANVRELWLFGSRADGHAKPESDVDLAIALTPDALGNYFCAWGRLATRVGRYRRQARQSRKPSCRTPRKMHACAVPACCFGPMRWDRWSSGVQRRMCAASSRDGWMLEGTAGVRLVILEGAMRSGKSSFDQAAVRPERWPTSDELRGR